MLSSMHQNGDMVASQSSERPLQDRGLRGQRLYLFSSNMQPLYAQNILEAIAAPTGQVATFRYGTEWLNEAAEENWSQLENVPVLIHFSLQHEAEYFEPALFPLRSGWVVEASMEGSYRFVEIELGQDVSLRWDEENPAPHRRDSQRFLPSLGEYRSFLDSNGIVHPYGGSATLGPDVLSKASHLLESSAHTAEHFARNANFLARTDAFESALFIRVLRLVDSETGAGLPLTGSHDGAPAFELVGGNSYTLEFFAYQPQPPKVPISIAASVGDSLAVQIVGEQGFDVASEYDRPRLAIQAGRPGGGQVLSTVLAVTPPSGVMGPKFSLHFDVLPSTRDKALNLGAPFVALGPIAAAAVVPDPLWSILLALLGVGLAIVLQWFGVSTTGLISPTASALRPSTEFPVRSTPDSGGTNSAPGIR